MMSESSSEKPKKPSRKSKRLSIEHLRTIGLMETPEKSQYVLTHNSSRIRKLNRTHNKNRARYDDDDDDDDDLSILDNVPTSTNEMKPSSGRTSPKIRDAIERARRRRESSSSSSSNREQDTTSTINMMMKTSKPPPPMKSIPTKPKIRGMRGLNRTPRSAPSIINLTMSGAFADSETESPPQLPKRPAFMASTSGLSQKSSSSSNSGGSPSKNKTPRRGSGLAKRKRRKSTKLEGRRKNRDSVKSSSSTRRSSNESTTSSKIERTDSALSAGVFVPGTPGSVDGGFGSSNSVNQKRISSGSDVHDKRVIRAGRVLKNKRKARDLWKWVDLLLTPSYLQYSYRRNIVGAILGNKKHKFFLKSEFTSITRESPCIFALHRPIEAPFQFRCASADECDEWFRDIQEALRPYLELHSLAKKNLILSDAGNVASNMNSAFKTTTPIKMIELGLVWKKKRFFGTWGRRRLRLEPEAAQLEFANIGDHITSSSTSSYFVRGGVVKAVDVDGVTEPRFKIKCRSKKSSSNYDTSIELRCQSQEQFKKIMMELHSVDVVLQGTLIIYGHMKDRISSQVEQKKKKRREELMLPPLMGHFIVEDRPKSMKPFWDKETARLFTCFCDMKMGKVHADGRNTPVQDNDEKDKIDDDLSDSEDSDAEDFKRERVNTGALNRSLHEGLECGHGMIQSILQNTNLISFKTQSSPSRKRLILEGYVLRAFTPGVTLSYTANKKIKGGEQFVVRGAAVIMSDLWENQILIECWKPPPDLVSVRLQVECEMGLEQTCHLLNLLRLRDAVLDWRCTMLLETYKRLRDSEKAMTQAMKELDEFNSKNLKGEATKNGWCSVATVLDENEIHAYEQRIKREFNSAEYHEKYYKLAVVKAIPKKTPSIHEKIMNDPLLRSPGIPPISTTTRKRQSKKRNQLLRKKSKAKSAPDVLGPGKQPGHIGSLRSQWTNALKNLPGHKRTKLYHNAEHNSIEDLLSDHDQKMSGTKSKNADVHEWLEKLSSLDNSEDDESLRPRSGTFLPPSINSRKKKATTTKSTTSSNETVKKGSSQDSSSQNRLNLSGKHAIFVLGPSAAGKSFLTRSNLRRVLSENAYDPQLAFVSIDGGIMRDASVFWNEMKRLPMQGKKKYAGFSDLFNGYFKPHIGANMVIPETAADPFPGIRGRAVDWLRRLRQANYSVVMTCVHASKNKCMEQGRGREGKEGKKYNNMSWSWAMSKVDQYFNYARELGYTRETFFVFDNSDWSNRNVLRVPPHHDLRLQLMYTDMGDTVGGFSTLPMRNINFARMNATLPPASVSLAWHEYYTRSGKDTSDVTMTKKKMNKRKSIRFPFGSGEKSVSLSPPKTKPVTPPQSPSKEGRNAKGGLNLDDALEAALQTAHQKLETSKNSFTIKSSSNVITNDSSMGAFEGVTAILESTTGNFANTAQKKTKLQLLQDGRSLWLVWNRGVRVPENVSKVLYACDSERAVLSWNPERCKAKRPKVTEVLNPEDMKRSLILSCVVNNKQQQHGSDADVSEKSSEGMKSTQRTSTNSIRSQTTVDGDEMSTIRVKFIITFDSASECVRWSSTLQGASDALSTDGYSRLESWFMTQENSGTTYKELVSAAENKFGKVFLTLHKGVFLQLYQDLHKFNDLGEDGSGEEGDEFSGSEFGSELGSASEDFSTTRASVSLESIENRRKSTIEDIMNDDFL